MSDKKLEERRAKARARMQAYRLANPEKIRAAQVKHDAKRRNPKLKPKPKPKPQTPCPISIPTPTDHSLDPACIAIRERFHAFRKNLRKQ